MKSKIDKSVDTITQSDNIQDQSFFTKFLLCMILPSVITAIFMFCIKVNSIKVACNTDLFFLLSLPFSIYMILVTANWMFIEDMDEILFSSNVFLFKNGSISVCMVCLFVFFGVTLAVVTAQPTFIFKETSFFKIVSFGFFMSSIILLCLVSFSSYIKNGYR